MRLDREQKNVIYKASVDWNLSSDPLAAAQLICSWFQTTPPRRPQGTFFRFYAWIYLFNSPFTKTTADDSTNKSLWRKKKIKKYAHIDTQARAPLDGAKPWALGLCWGCGEGNSRDRGCISQGRHEWVAHSIFKPMLELPTGLFGVCFPRWAWRGARPLQQTLRLVALGGGCGVRWPQGGGLMRREVCKAQQRVRVVSLASVTRCPSVTAHSWGVPEVFLAPGRGTGVHRWEHEEEKLSSLYFGATRDSKQAFSLYKGSHCLR